MKLRHALAHVRCPDHGPHCGGASCCCPEWHWRPLAFREHMRLFAVDDDLAYRVRHRLPMPELPRWSRDLYWVKVGYSSVYAGERSGFIRTTWHVRFRLPFAAAGSVTASLTRRRRPR